MDLELLVGNNNTSSKATEDDDDDDENADNHRTRHVAATVINIGHHQPLKRNVSGEDKKQTSKYPQSRAPRIPKQQQQQQQNSNNWKLWVVVLILSVWALANTFSIFLTHHAATGSNNMIIAAKKSNGNNKWVYPFNLIENNKEQQPHWMSLKIPTLSFERILRYDICCRHNNNFFCRSSISRNMGIDGYVQHDGTVMIQIIHPDMLGASCNFIWAERHVY